MWTRKEMKTRAKSALKPSYWPLFWLSLLVTVLSLDKNQIINQINIVLRLLGRPTIPIKIDFDYIITSIIVLAIAVFVVDILNVGLSRVYILNHYGQLKPDEVLFGFRNGYLHVLWVQLSTSLIILLGFLLFVIPGIILAYSYRMVPYLLSENPKLTGRQARELSTRMTDGEKINLFFLDFSFIGWLALGLLCLGVGIVFVQPYLSATYAEVYLSLRDQEGIEPILKSIEGE